MLTNFNFQIIAIGFSYVKIKDNAYRKHVPFTFWEKKKTTKTTNKPTNKQTKTKSSAKCIDVGVKMKRNFFQIFNSTQNSNYSNFEGLEERKANYS